MKRRPDFIIIGAMKCATSTLHEQLAAQPGIFMTTPKEPNFFSDDAQYARGIQWYEALFDAAAPHDLRGESSTHYTKLPTWPRTIQRMIEHLGREVKLIYIMRHPTDRLISHYIHEWTQRVIDCPIDEAIERHPELIAYSRYAMQLEPYLDAFGRERILPLFFDAFTAQPQATLERACAFIGYAGRPRWNDSLGEQNVSRERLRRSPVRDLIVDFPGARALRRALVPQAARDWIKGLWTMKSRPELSEQNVQRLAAVFDDDLAVVGRWLGIDALRCDTFKSIARTHQPQWAAQPRAAKVGAA